MNRRGRLTPVPLPQASPKAAYQSPPMLPGRPGNFFRWSALRRLRVPPKDCQSQPRSHLGRHHEGLRRVSVTPAGDTDGQLTPRTGLIRKQPKTTKPPVL
ncbi:hypothetical protein Bbelb_101030 [Branchiostoma belcheri]|nr:hypothetical protein Bbelb_101030 [Branchiostoma belcheri]